MRIRNYTDVLRYLNSFINYERIVKFIYKKSLKLERTHSLFKNLRIEPQALKTIHIAGTKGKGSVAHFLGYILSASGLRIGLYTSPHFKDFRERIRIIESSNSGICSRLISERQVITLVREMKPALEKLRFHKRLGQLSFFEVYTALAFKYFLNEDLDFVILECGLGGRLDATNLCKSLISVITKIDYDHTQQLGKTLEEIAWEKAGIIKDNSLVVSAQQRRAVEEVLRKKAKERDSKIYFYKKDFFSQNLRFKPNYTLFDYSSFLGAYKDLKIRNLGEHQVENASLGIFCFQLLKRKFRLEERNLCRGLKEVFVRGRFQIIKKGQTVYILDVAHNPLSIKVVNSQIKRYFPSKKVILIFGCSKNKPSKKMLKEISYDRIIITKANHPRAYNPWEIKKESSLKECIIIPSLKEAIRRAEEFSDFRSIIVITGSFFLVAEALTELEE